MESLLGIFVVFLGAETVLRSMLIVSSRKGRAENVITVIMQRSKALKF